MIIINYNNIPFSGHDRYIRMKYLNDYSTIMTTTRVHVEATCGFVVILLFSSVYVTMTSSTYYQDFVQMMGKVRRS